MSKKPFFLGVLTGLVLAFVVLFIIGLVNRSSDDDSIQYFENPVSYEDKTEASFRVFQVWGDHALAEEKSSMSFLSHNSTTVLLIGDDLYNDQVVKVKNPMRIGNYSYTTQDGRNLTVPVINCSN